MMAPLIKPFLWIIIVAIGVSCNYDNLKLKDLPEEIQKQLQYIFSTFFLDELTTNCTDFTEPTVKYLLYNTGSPDNPIEVDINDPHQISGRNKLVVIVHGWLASSTSSKILHLKDEYLKRYDDCNVVLVDWSQAAYQPYNITYCDVSGVGISLADFVCNLANQQFLHPGEIHAIGHSMGGQAWGLAAEYIKDRCDLKLGRITGLDIAGLIFEKLPDSKRLDKRDAELVDVIHTEGDNRIGFWLNTGSADFHPNCGHNQPGCPELEELKPDTSVSDIFCSSDRSIELMAESINDHNLIAVSCGLCPRRCNPFVINEVYTVMGEEFRETLFPWTKYMIPTNGTPPYGLGWTPYPNKPYMTKEISN